MSTRVGTWYAVGMHDGGDDELLTRLRSGEPAAAEAFVRRFGGAMFAAARRLLANEEDARDALQDAFLSAFRALDRFDGRAKLSTWLHRVAVNAALMKLRSKKRRPERPIDDFLPKFLADEHQADPPAPWATRPDGVVESQERAGWCGRPSTGCRKVTVPFCSSATSKS
ncbi:MAG: sigma-70 family RNA polymerase sigma factor [Gemmataceae bacterium]